MNRKEAYKVAHDELLQIEGDGYAIASEHIETTHLKQISGASGSKYDVEISYLWKDQEHEEILVICRVTSKDWFSHEHLEESLVLSSG
jgi:hypothetical protein